MPNQQRLISMDIRNLKNLKNVVINFDENKRLTAILGPNGFGKSTILHSLAASFKPTRVQQGNIISTQGEDHRYVQFFPGTPYGVWANTDVDILHSFRLDNAKLPSRDTIKIQKGLRQWRPFAEHRPERETYFIGVGSATPAIEGEWADKKFRFKTRELDDADSLEIKTKVGEVLKRNYTRFHSNAVSKQESLLGLEYQGINYSALSMGAGEQRLLHLLHVVKKAGKYALILIDEIDLLLHTDALHRLLHILNSYAQEKKLQIIFTTHRETVVQFGEFVAIRHLYQSSVPPYKTFCFTDTKPDALYRLTGDNLRPLQVSCEDEVAKAIIEKVAQLSHVGKYVDISRYGSASNCFTLAAALLFSAKNLEQSLFVLDGDNPEATEAGRASGINKALTGTEIDIDERRAKALSYIVQFMPEGQHNPEYMLHKMVCTVAISHDAGEQEVIAAAHDVMAEPDAKLRLTRLAERLGGSPDRALGRIVDIASRAPYWGEYTTQIHTWFEEKGQALIELQPANAQ